MSARSGDSEKYFGQRSIKPRFSRAKKSLKAAESTAATAPTKAPAKQAEEKSLYTGQGRQPQKAKGRSGFRNFRKRGPFAILLLVLAVGGLGIFGGSSLLGAQLDSLITSLSDTQYTAITLRKRSVLKQVLNGKLSPSNYLKQRLAKYDIEISDGATRTLTHKGTVINASNFDSAISDNAEFRDSISRATHGRTANFYDSSSEVYFSDMNQTRDVQRNFRQTGNNATDTENYNSMMYEYFDGDASTTIDTVEDRPVMNDDGTPALDDNGEQIYERTTTEGAAVRNTDLDAETSADRAHDYLLGTSRKVAAAGGLACAVLKVGNLVSIAVAAVDIYNAINYFMTGSEPQSKVMAGEGNNSSIHQWLTSLATPSTTTVVDPTTNEEVTYTGSALEGNLGRSAMGGSTPNKSLAKNFSIERPFVSVMTALTTNALSTRACGAVQVAGAVLSLATVASGGFVKLSIGLLLDTVLSTAVQLALATTIVGILQALIPTIASTLFTNAFTNASGIAQGELYFRGAMQANSIMLGRSTSGQTPASEEEVLAYNRANNVILAQDAEVERLYKSPFDATSPNTFLGNLVSKLLPLSTTSGLISGVTNLNTLATTSLASLNATYADGAETTFLTSFGDDCSLSSGIGAAADAYCDTRVTTDLSVIDLPLDDPTYRAVIDPNLEYDENGNEVIKDNSPLAEFIVFALDRKSPFGVPDAGISEACQTDFGVLRHIPIIENAVDIINTVEEVECLDEATGAKYVNSADNEYWQTEGKYYQLYVSTTRVLDQFNEYEETGTTNPVIAFREKYYAEHPLDNTPSGYLARISGLSKSDAELVLAVAEYGTFLANYDPSSRFTFGGIEEGVEGLSFSSSVARREESSIRGRISLAERPRVSPAKEDSSRAALRLYSTEKLSPSTLTILYPDLRNRSYAA